MNNKPLAIAFRIYIIALFLNTIIGTVMMASLYNLGSFVMALLIMGSLMGALVALPALPVMYMLIRIGRTRHLPTGKLFVWALVTAALMSVIAFSLYVECFDGQYTQKSYLFLALFSGITATASQFRSFEEVVRNDRKTIWEIV